MKDVFFCHMSKHFKPPDFCHMSLRKATRHGVSDHIFHAQSSEQPEMSPLMEA